MLLAPVNAAALADVLRATSGEPLVVLLGAGASNPRPSSLPFASPWKALLLELIAERSGLSTDAWEEALRSVATDAHSRRLGEPRNLLKLEAVFSELEAVRPGLATAAASVTTSVIEPNAIHHLLAATIERGAVRGVVTTNWDGLVEAALAERGIVPISWVAGGGTWLDTAHVYKVHGSQDRPSSLRHTFATVNRRFIADELEHLRELCSGTVAAIGYAGADYDVRGAFDSGGTVYWLHSTSTADLASGSGVAPGAASFAQGRPVVPVGGGFGELLAELGLPWDGMGEPDRLREPTSAVFDGLTADEAREVLAAILLRMRVTDADAPVNAPLVAPGGALSVRALDDAYLQHLRRVASGRRYVVAAIAARDHHEGRRWRAGLRSLRLAVHRERRWRHLSDAADAFETLGQGVVVILRPIAAVVHWLAVRGADDDADDWIRFRLARSMSWFGLRRRSLHVIDAALTRPHDTYVEGQFRRRRALLLAASGEQGWQAELAMAIDLFGFEERMLEIASVLRADAVCTFLATGDGLRARSRLQAADALTDQRASRRRNAVLAWLFTRRTVGRRLLLLAV